MLRTSHNQDLRERNTFRMKVSCRTFIEYDSEEDLLELDFDALPSPVKHIGGGSNLLFTGDFPGTILHSAIRHIEELPDRGDEVPVRVGAGVEFDRLCGWAAERGLWGPENLSHIPGEAGASAVQNIGAYGVEAKDLIREVRAFDTVTRKFVTFRVEDCRYAYRDSIFKAPEMKDRHIITEVLFSFRRDSSPVLEYGGLREMLPACGAGLGPKEVREAIIAIRRRKLPETSEVGSAGSYFKNPVVSPGIFRAAAKASGMDESAVPHYEVSGEDGSTMVKIPAAWLIDRCGWKEAAVGNARVWKPQPLVIVNASGNATPAEILDLEERIRKSVYERFGINLSPEVEHV